MDSTAQAAAQAIVTRIEQIVDARPDLNQRALAERAGLSPTQMNRVMNHQRKITATELAMIADALGVPAAELLGESGQQLSVAARVGRAERAPELEGPFLRAQRLLEVRELLDRVVSRPEAEPRPDVHLPARGLDKHRGRRAADALRAAIGVEPGECLGDLEGLAARFGLDVSTQPLPANLHGLLVFGAAGTANASGEDGAGGVPAVALLNAGDPLGRRRFTLAHELAHLLFGDGALAIVDYRKQAKVKDDRWTPERLAELRADHFAAHLLAPDAGVLALADEFGPKPATPNRVPRWGAQQMARVAATYGMSFESAGYRLNDTGVLDDEERTRAQACGAMRAFRDIDAIETGEQLTSTVADVEPPFALLTQALAAYRAEELGLKPVASLYDMSAPEELARLRAQLREAGWEPADAPF